MKIRYKLISLLILIILLATLPMSYFILKKEEQEKISQIFQQGITTSRILSRLSTNILLMNGGEISATRVDSKETMEILRLLTKNGLVHADTFLVSSKEKYNGILLSTYSDKSLTGSDLFPGDRMPASVIKDSLENREVKETLINGIGMCYEFISKDPLPEQQSYSIARLIFSKDLALAPVNKLRKIMIATLVSVIVVVTVLGLLLSRFISRPIMALTSGVQRFESGDFDFRVKIKNKDEVGRLGKSFNMLAETLKNKVKELEVVNKELTRMDRLKDDLLANISHELRTPLQGIIGLSESLIDGAAGPLNREAMNNMILIVNSGKRLSYLIDDIMDFSLLKNQDIHVELNTVDMHSVSQMITSISRPSAEKKKIKLINNIPHRTVFVLGDRNRLQQIMMNLVDNAVKYTEKGEVSISAKVLLGNDSFIEISVSDSGVGISKDRLKTIFDPIVNPNIEKEKKSGSTGLGLAITKKLVELHGGTIRAETKEGSGSSFFFTLKKSVNMSVNTTESDYIQSEKFTDNGKADYEKTIEDEKLKQIMIIDDEPVNIQVLVNILRLEKYEVIPFSNAPEAIELLEKGRVPDLIILDVMLPVMSGFEACKIIRDKYPPHELPIIMLTAKNKTSDIVIGLEAGANDYLQKPISKEELIARVKNLISMKETIDSHSRMMMIRQELDLAREIQSTLLPENPPEMKNIKMAVRYVPMYEVGGDFYDFTVIGDEEIGVFIADVAGHGIPAALVSNMLQAALNSNRENAGEPSLIISKINSVMSKFTHEQYATACYAEIDYSKKIFKYCNAGHCPIVILRKDIDDLIIEKDSGRPIGIFEDTYYFTKTLEIMKGDRIILFTDCVIETRNHKREMFGFNRFYDMIKKNRSSNCDEFSDLLISTLREWADVTRDKGLGDDLTLIVIDIL